MLAATVVPAIDAAAGKCQVAAHVAMSAEFLHFVNV